MSFENCLLTPGPLPISSFVKEGMLVDVGSRDSYFKQVTQEIRDTILTFAGGDGSHAVIPIQGGGTFAIEAAIATFVGPRDKVLVCVNGLYGERIAKILRLRGLACETLVTPATEPPDVGEVASRLEADPTITHLCLVHCETTTGILNPMRALVREAQTRGVLTIVDSMSAFGAIPVDAAVDGFDVLVTSSNKCLEAPPGLAFAVVSHALLNRRSVHATSYVLDLYDQWRAFERCGEWRSTPPTHVTLAVHRALAGLVKEGVAARHARYVRIRERLVANLTHLGFVPILRSELRSPICLALRAEPWLHDQESFERLYRYLADDRLYIYAKLHQPTRSFRIGCIGQIQEAWIDRLIDRMSEFVRMQAPLRRALAYPVVQVLPGAA